MPAKKSNVVLVTSSEERVLEAIKKFAEENRKASLKEIGEMSGLGYGSIRTALYGKKGGSSGLFAKVPSIKRWVRLLKGKKEPVEIDVSYFLDLEADVVTKKTETPNF